MAAPVVVEVNSSAGTSSSITFTSFVSDGNNRFLAVCGGEGGTVGGNVFSSAPTFNSTALTNQRWNGVNDGNWCISDCWTTTGPAATTASVVLAFNSNNQYHGAAILFNDVNQTTPIGAVSTKAQADTANSISPASAVGDLVFAYTVTDEAAGSLSVSGGGTQEFEAEEPGQDTTSSGQTKAGAASSTTMSWSQTLTGYATGGFAVKPLPTSVALTGTITASVTETDIVNGGKTIILTVTGDTWIVN